MRTSLPNLLLVILLTMVVGCSESTSPAPTPPPDEAPSIATIEITGAPARIVVGQSAALGARVTDADGEVRADVKVAWASSSESALVPGRDGTMTAIRAGVHLVTAYVGSVQSAPVIIRVVESEALEEESIAFRVALPEWAADREVALFEPGQDALHPLGADVEPTTVSKWDNRLLIVVELPSKRPLLLAFVRGATPSGAGEGRDTPLVVDFGTTAEALLFIASGFPVTSPEALGGLRAFFSETGDAARLAEALQHWTRTGGSWSDHLPKVLPELHDALLGLNQRMKAVRESLAPAGSVSKADDALQVTVIPQLAQSGLTVEIWPCDDPPYGDVDALSLVEECELLAPEERSRKGMLIITNAHARYVTAYLERDDGSVAMGPIYMGAMTYVGSFWETALTTWGDLGSGGDGEPNGVVGASTFFSTSTTHRLIDFDPEDGGSLYRLLIYGPGVWGSTIPAAYSDFGETVERSVIPWLLTAVLSYGANVLSAIAGGASDTMKAFSKETVELLTTLLGSSKGPIEAISQVLGVAAEGFDQKFADEDLFGAFAMLLGTFVDKVVEIVVAAGVPGADFLGDVAVIPVIWDVVASLANAGMTVLDFFYSERGSMFTVRGLTGGAVAPLDRILPAAEAGCPWEAELTLLFPDTQYDHSWSFSPAENSQGGWRYEASGPNTRDFRIWRDAEHPMSEADAVDGQARVTVGVSPVKDGVTQEPLDHGDFTFYVAPNAPRVMQLQLPDGPSSLEPGAEVPVRIEAWRCGSTSGVSSGTITGEILAAPAVLTKASDGWLEGTLQLADVAVDGPGHLIEIHVVAEDETEGTATRELTVANVPPELLPAGFAALPGDAVSIDLTVHDPNFDGTLLSEIPASGVSLGGSDELSITPTLADVSFHWAPELSTPEQGLLVLHGEPLLVVSSPHPDNDGKDGFGGTPILVPVTLMDASGALALDAHLEVTIRNAAPRILNEDATITISEEAPPPGSFVVRVADDNGVADIAAPIIEGVNPGFLEDSAQTVDGERRFTYLLDQGALAASCDPYCEVVFRAPDKDDDPENGGLSDPFVVVVSLGELYPCGPDLPPCPSVCTPEGALLERTCLPETGLCSPPSVAEDCAAKGEVCREGACRAPCEAATDCTATGLDVDCTDATTLTAWTCPDGGCIPTPTDCAASGTICHEGECRAPCTSDESCPPGCTADGVARTFTCVYSTGQCALKTETPCDPLACSGGACHEKCPGGPDDCPSPFCYDAEVRIFWVCEGEICLPQETDCGELGLTCSYDVAECTDKCTGPGDCPPECTPDGLVRSFECGPSGVCEPQSETACDAGETCTDGVCRIPCGAGTPCPQAECVSPSVGEAAARVWTCEAGFCASSDTSCGEGGCKGGACVAACVEDADCPPTCDGAVRSVWQCSGGACELASAAPCPSGSSCIDGECLVPCVAISDCPGAGVPVCLDDQTLASHECEAGFCQPTQTVCLDGFVCSPAEGDCVPPCVGTCPDVCNEDKDALIHRSCLDSGVCQPGSETACTDKTPECVDGECRRPCKEDNDCVAGLGAAKCLPSQILQERVCGTDGYCHDQVTDCTKLGAECSEGACVPIACSADSECPGWCSVVGAYVAQSCVDGACVSSQPESCGDGQVCTPAGCAVGCAVDADCPDGWACSLDDPASPGHCRECSVDTDCPGAAVPYCSADQTKVMRLLCVAYACAEVLEADCSSATSTCEGGACLLPACEGDTDCGEGMLCIHAGTLDAECVQCTEDYHCAGDCFGTEFLAAHCVEGVCALDEPASCPPGQACIDLGACGALCGPEQPCPDGQTCVEPETGFPYCAECETTADCAGGGTPTVCQGDQVVKVSCVAKICEAFPLEDCQQTGQVCVAGSGACGAKSCQVDTDCVAPFVCAGLNTESPFCAECREDFHCPPPECTAEGVVRGSACSPEGKCEPADLADCKAMGLECVDGTCGTEVPGCCTAHDGPGCETASCQACVCAPDKLPGCCEEGGAWSYECLGLALDGCAAECACEAPCCESHPDSPGCSDKGCESCVCSVDPTCCAEGWHVGCDTIAASTCQGTCGCAGSACVPHEGPGANDPGCAECVCFGAGQDPGCCETEWGYFCSEAARVVCAEPCGCDAPCCEPHPGKGCELGACETCVCALSPECCSGEWTEACAELATGACAVVCECAGDCCGDHEAPGCNSNACEQCVCDTPGNATCCVDGWTSTCNEAAQTDCFSACGCLSGCCEGHDTPGCDDGACSDCVCSKMPSCCDSPWTDECADLARTECVPECGCKGTCCEAHAVAPGCDEAACEGLVCAVDPACCQEAWTEACSAIAKTTCDPCVECTTDESCDDGIGCTVDACVASACVHTPDDSLCDDTLDCTVDTCKPETGCYLEPTGIPCCTSETVAVLPVCDMGVCGDPLVEDCAESGMICVDGLCISACTLPCDDGNPCTVDTCEAGDCIFTPSDAACDDGDVCTVNTCTVDGCDSTALACDDLDPCTLDACLPEQGCVHASDGLPCCNDDKSLLEVCSDWGEGSVSCGASKVEDCTKLGMTCTDGRCQDCVSAADCEGGGGVVCEPQGAGRYVCRAGRCTREAVWPEPLQPGDEVETLEVDANFPDLGLNGALSTEPLGCATYCVWVEGTLSKWPASAWEDACGTEPEPEPMFSSLNGENGPTGRDPRYVFAYPAGSDECADAKKLPTAHDDLLVRMDGLNPGSLDGWWTPDWKFPLGYRADHRYRFEVTGPAPGLAVSLAQYSGSYYGKLSVRITLGPCTSYTPAPLSDLGALNATVVTAEGKAPAPLWVVPGMEATITTGGAPVLALFVASETRFWTTFPTFDEGLVKLDLLKNWNNTFDRSLLGFHEDGWELRDASIVGLKYLDPGTVELRIHGNGSSGSTSTLGAGRSLHVLELGNAGGPMPTWSEDGWPGSAEDNAWVTPPGYAQYIVTSGGPVWMIGRVTGATLEGPTVGRARLDLAVDGESRALAIQDFHNGGAEERDITLYWLENLPAGLHVVELRWARGYSDTDGDGTLSASRMNLAITELRGALEPLDAWQTSASDPVSLVAGKTSTVPGMELSFETPGVGPALLLFKAGGTEVTGTSTGQAAFALELDGVEVGGWHTQQFHNDGDELRDVTLLWQAELPSGSHLARVKWRSDKGLLTTSGAGATRVLQVIRLRDPSFDDPPDCDDANPCTDDAWTFKDGCTHASTGLPCCLDGQSVVMSCGDEECTAVGLEDCTAIGLPCVDGRCTECASDEECPGAGAPICEPEGLRTYQCKRARCEREVYLPEPLGPWDEVGDLLLPTRPQTGDPIHASAVSGTLEECVSYCAWVEGTYSPWDAAAWSDACDTTPDPGAMYPSADTEDGPTGLDPAYVYAYPAGTPYCDSAQPLPVPHADFRYRLDGQTDYVADLDGWLQPAWKDWGGGYSLYHYYAFDVVGAAAPLSLGLAGGTVGKGYGDLYAYVETAPCDYDPPPILDPARVQFTSRTSWKKVTTSSPAFEVLGGINGGLYTTGDPWLMLAHVSETQLTSAVPAGAAVRYLVDDVERSRTVLGFHNNGWEVRDVSLLGLDYLAPGQHQLRVEWQTETPELTAGWNGGWSMLYGVGLGNADGPMPAWKATLAGPVSTESNEWTPVPGMSSRIVSGGGPVWILFQGAGTSVTGTPLGRARFRLLVDGALKASTVLDFHNDGYEARDASVYWLESLPAGEHELRVEWARGASKDEGEGTLTTGSGGASVTLVAAELRGTKGPLATWQTASTEPVSVASKLNVPLPGMEQAFTMAASGTAIVVFKAGGTEATGAAPAETSFALEVDGTVQKWTIQQFHNGGGELRDVFLMSALSLSSGPHVVRVRWFAADGQLSTSVAGATRVLQVLSLIDPALVE